MEAFVMEAARKKAEEKWRQGPGAMPTEKETKEIYRQKMRELREGQAEMAKKAARELEREQQQLAEEEEDDLLSKLADLELSEGEAGEEGEGEVKEGGGERGGGGKAQTAVPPAGMESGVEGSQKR